jgi:hypothetical protein
MARKYWLTIQWPHENTVASGTPHDGVYAVTGRHYILSQIQVGDIVFIYETKTGRREVGRPPRYTGCQHIVTIAEVIAPVAPTGAPTSNYTDGSSLTWGYSVDTKNICSHGRVSQHDTNIVLDYAADYNFHGFGVQHSGVREIDVRQASELKVFFCGYPIAGATCPCALVI